MSENRRRREDLAARMTEIDANLSQNVARLADCQRLLDAVLATVRAIRLEAHPDPESPDD